MSTLTEAQVGIYVQQRLNLPDTSRLRLQSLIGSALNNLALDYANDGQKRKWLMTDPGTVTSSVTSLNGQNYTDLTTVISTYGVMKDYLMYGTVYWNNTFGFAYTDVSVADNTITHVQHNMSTGDPVRLTTAGTLPGGLSLSTTYWVIAVTTNIISFAVNQTDAFAGTAIDLSSQGTVTSTVTVYGRVNTIQWIDSPAFGLLQNALPIPYVYGWLDADKLFLSGATDGTISYQCPFVPTLQSLPDFLANDLLNSIVDLALTAGHQGPTPPAEK